MTIMTSRFGAVEFEEERIVRMIKGLPGLEELTSYVLIKAEETRPIVWLQSTEDPAVALPMIYTFEIIEEYAFDVQDEEIAALSIQKPEELMVLTVVVLTEDLAQMTANLVAPVLINMRTGQGCQVLLDQPQYSTKTPILERIVAFMQKEGAANAGANP